MRTLRSPLGTPGKRIHALMLLVAAFYLAAHVKVGLWLGAQDLPFAGFVLALTLAVAIGNVVVAVPVWVFTGWSLIRGPRPLVPLPAPVDDDALPDIVVQIPGRNEPFEEVRRSIDAVLEADYPPDKLRVQFVDNSDDDRWTEVERFYANEPRVSVEHRDGTTGFKGGNLNHGLSKLGAFEDPSNVLIGLLDVGDTFAPKVIRPMATEFVNDSKLGFVQDMFRIGNPRETIINWSDSYVGDAARRFTEGYMAHYGLPTMNGHCALLRLSALEETGRWNESRVAEDWSTGISMLANGWTGKWVDYAPHDPDMVSTELVPGDIAAQQKQKRRWATGGTELAKYHLREWLRSTMPWHQRLSLFIRLGANASVLPSFLVQLLFPVWLALAFIGDAPLELLAIGLVSTVVQNPFVLANTAAAINYAREGRFRTGLMVLLAYPVQVLWRLPVFAHAGIGIAEGLTRGLKTFVITPKSRESQSIVDTLASQRLVVLVSMFTFVPLAAILAFGDTPSRSLIVATAALPVLTIAALFLVPSTEWVRQRIRRRR